ncbi:MAG: DUF4199 domain-containing protein [Gemmatimonadota bacterium]
MRRIVLTFGLIGGGLLSAMMLLALPFQDRIGFDNAMIVGYTSMVLAFLMVWVGVRRYRDTVAGGTIGFGRALAVGAGITLVTTACYVATWEVIYYGFMPDFGERYGEYLLEKERAAGAPPERLEARAQELADFRDLYRNPLINIAFTFIEPLPVGLLFTLVAAGVHSRKRSRTGEAPSPGGAVPAG